MFDLNLWDIGRLKSLVLVLHAILIKPIPKNSQPIMESGHGLQKGFSCKDLRDCPPSTTVVSE